MSSPHLRPRPTVQQGAQKVQILNFGTFHMGLSSDATTTEFDKHDRENRRKVHEVAQQLSAFRPTVIVVERPSAYDERLQENYRDYLEDPDIVFEQPSEIELLAFELGRLCGTERIDGIDLAPDDRAFILMGQAIRPTSETFSVEVLSTRW